MNVSVVGASGFIGSSLRDSLILDNHIVTAIGRMDFNAGRLADLLADADCVINLAGESIAGLWTKRKKKRIYASRVSTMNKLVEAVNKKGNKVKIFITVSGVGIYDLINVHDESSSALAHDFLANVIKDWEGHMEKLKDRNIHKAVLRLGLVLGIKGGILKKIAMPFRFGLGYTIESRDSLPFIHIQDLICVVREVMRADSLLDGVINVVSPYDISIKEFYETIGSILNCKIRLKLKPAFIKRLLGESSIVLIRGQKVIPEKLLRIGFTYQYMNLREALNSALQLTNI